MYRTCFCLLLLLLLSSVHSFAQTSDLSLIPFQAQNGQLGYKNASEQIIIDPQFEEASPFTNNFAFVKKNNLWGMINTKGKWIIPASYENIGWTLPKDKSIVLAGEVVGFEQKGKWGLISTRNKVISPPIYDVLLPLGNDKIKTGQVSSASPIDTLLGVVNIQGKEIIPLQYHTLEATPIEGVLLVGLNKIYNYKPSGVLQNSIKALGLISWANTILMPVTYKHIAVKEQTLEITPFNSWRVTNNSEATPATYALDSMFAISADKYAFAATRKMGFVEDTSVFQANKDTIYPEQKGFILYRTGQEYGVAITAASSFQPFITAKYDSIALDTKEFIRGGTRKGSHWEWHLIKNDSNNAATITPQPYSWIAPLSNNVLIKVQSNNLYGYINKQGTEVIPAQYDSLGEFIDSVCVAVYKGKYGILQQNNKWLIEPNADYLAINKYGYTIRKKSGRYEVADKAGKVKHTSAVPLHFLADGSVALKQNGKVGRLSPTGVPSVPAVYDSISPITTVGTYWAYSGKNIHLYNASGEILLKQGNAIEKLKYIQDEEFFPARINGKYGFVDGFGRLRIANQYEEVRPFEGELAAVKLAGKWGFVTRGEKIAVQPYYDQVSSFNNEKSIARKGNKYGIIDQQGKVVTSFSYEKITAHSSGNYVMELKGRQGMLNKKGFQAIYAKYDEVQPQVDDKAIVILNNKYGLLDSKGLIVLPVSYDKIIKNPFSTAYLTFEKAQPFTANPTKLFSTATNRKK